MNNKQKQMLAIHDWLNAIEAACELVVYENEVTNIEPFEIISLINVRLHMETIKETKSEVKPDVSKPNLFLLKPSNNDKN